MIIELKNVNKTYPHKSKPALQIDNLKIVPGHLYGVIGPNGAGKSTLFKTITTIVQSTGDILFDGVDVRKEPMVLGKIGIVLDDLTLFKEWTGQQNIDYFATLKGYTKTDELSVMAEKLALTKVLDTKVRDYSLGMNKKLILLIALMDDAEVLILDEPFRGIDRQSVDQLTAFIKEEFMRPEKTVLISSHVANDIESVADSFIYLSDGRLVDQGEITANILIVTTKHVAEFAKVLAETETTFTQQDDRFELKNVSEEQWSILFKQAVLQGVTFDTVNRQTDIRERLN